MTEPTQILYDRLMSRLRQAIEQTVDLDGAGNQAIEVSATALTDTLAIVLSRLPSGSIVGGVETMGTAMAFRLVQRISAEVVTRGTLIKFGGGEQPPGYCETLTGKALDTFAAPPAPPAPSRNRAQRRRTGKGMH